MPAAFQAEPLVPRRLGLSTDTQGLRDLEAASTQGFLFSRPKTDNSSKYGIGKGGSAGRCVVEYRAF